MDHKTRNFQNILVIDFGQLGDVVLSLPALKAIRHKFAASNIAVLTGMAAGEIVTLSGLADEVIKVDRVELRDGPRLASIAKIFRLVSDIRRRKIDLVIDLHSLSETNLLAFLSKAKHRLLANRESRSLDILSNFSPSPPKEDKAKHLGDRYLDVLIPLGVDGSDRRFVFQTSAVDLEFVRAKFFNDSQDRLIGIFPGAGHPSRCWSLDNFAQLASRLVSDGYIPVVFLGPEEKAIKDQVKALFPPSTILVDGLSLAQFIAAAGLVKAFVTNDTGPMHLAACAGTPILLLLDERAPMTYLPLTDRLAIIRDKTIDKISVDETMHALADLINSGSENDKTFATW
ncbi:MAG: glycosyltransferase family 9 protein [Chloracidobacterium sp.]|nr:glycosyltransferase family 9 protein [Chloracidobacterium sp.]